VAGDPQLVLRAQHGDEGAFTELYLRYFDRIYRYMRVTLGDADEAEDGAQRVFLSVFQALPRYDTSRPQPLEAWLFTIARNQAITIMRQRRRAVPLDPATVELELERRPPPSRYGSAGAVDDAHLLAAIQGLPYAQRHVIALRYVLGLATADIARAIGRDARAVRQLHHRALRSLEKRLVNSRRPARAPRESAPRPAR
jgi:RNA polymerase sigma-70 factor (ECF subfamily)